MKRSPLKRTAGLARSEGLQRGMPLARGAGLSSSKRRPPKPTLDETSAIATWHAEVVKAATRCAVCDADLGKLANVGLRPHGHHVVARQFLKKVASERGIPAFPLIWDPRGAMALCATCHMDHEAGTRRIPARALSYSNRCFASDLGLDWYIERTYS